MANIYTGSQTARPDERNGTGDQEGHIGLSVEEIVRGPQWSILRVRLAEVQQVTLRFDCGSGRISIPADTESPAADFDLLFRSADVARSAFIAVSDELGEPLGNSALRPAAARQADAVIELQTTSESLAGQFVDLTGEKPGGRARLRFFGQLDLDLDLEPAGRPLWGPAGRVARQFDLKRTALLQALRGIDPDLERLWPLLPKVAFLGAAGTSLAEAPFAAPRSVAGAIESIARQAIGGHLATGGGRHLYDIFVNGVRYHSALTESDGRFSFVPPHPDPDEAGVDISVAAGFTRSMLPVEVPEAAVEIAPEEPPPAGDWSWISPAALAARKVSVIVPVYNAPGDLARCLRSVVANVAGISRLIVIDDCSTDNRVEKVLSVFRGSGVEIFHNPENLGFTRTVNRGIDLAGGDDVILLNSDTIVPPGWAGSLKTAAYSGLWIATATPLSNNAGAFSVPEIGVANALPDELSVDACARLYRAASVGAYPRVPTGNGFCMYVRRDCLDVIGTFDETAFPVGYGEENDLCMRAVRAGFEHVIDDRTFVFHARSASFGKLKAGLYASGRAVIRERYPEYDELIRVFSEGTTMLDVRWRIRNAFLRHRANPHSPGRTVAFAVAAPSDQATLDGGGFDDLAPDDRRFALASRNDGIGMWQWRADRWEFREKRGSLPDDESPKARERAVQHLLVRYGVDVLVVRDFDQRGINLAEIANALGISIYI